MSTTIRVSDETKRRFAVISRSTGRPMTELLDEAVDALERRLFFGALNSQYAALRRDERAWAEVEGERALEEGSLRDRS